MPPNPKVAGQIVNVAGGRVVLVGETLADVLDPETWEVVADTYPPPAPPEVEAEREAALEAWERRVRENPPARVNPALASRR